MEIMFESNDLSRREEATLCSKPSKKKVRIRLEQRIQRLHVKNTVQWYFHQKDKVFSALYAETNLKVTWSRRWE